MNRKLLAKFLLAAQVLTVLWLLTCPKFAKTGEFETKKTELIKEQSGKSRSGNGPWVINYRHRQITTDYFRHPDPVIFSAGLLVIYMLTLSAFILTNEGHTTSNPSRDPLMTPPVD